MAKGIKTGGRKKGSRNKATAGKEAAIAKSGLTPLEFMLNLMRMEVDEDADIQQRIAVNAMRFEAAKAAAPYVHPRLNAVEHTGKDGGPIETKEVTDNELTRWLAFEATKSVIKKAQHEPA